MNTTQEEIHVALARKGFLVFKKAEHHWLLRKIPMPEDSRIIEETPFLSYEAALQEATRLLDPPSQTIKWSVVMRFNRGLGPEMRALDYIDAGTQAEARTLASQLAEDFCRRQPGFEKAKIIEVRTLPYI